MSNAPASSDLIIDRCSFTVHRETKSLVTEFSDLGILAQHVGSTLKVIRDRGLWMKTKTGVWSRWIWSDLEEHDGEPVLIPDETSVLKVPALEGWTMTLIND